MDKKVDIIKFAERRPASQAVFGYGSGVFEQRDSEHSKAQTDVIFIVKDIKEWHLDNMTMNDQDYSFLGRIHFSQKNVAKIKGKNNITYFSHIKDYDGEYLTWTTDGANAGRVFYRKGKFNITNVCGLLDIKDKKLVNPKYLYYALSIETDKYVNRGMGNAKLMSNVMDKIIIVIPPINVQKQIVDILDKFDKLCCDIATGLPAEIKLRDKQYEYYRDKLLAFKEKTV